MPRPITVTLEPTAADAESIVAEQTPEGAAALTLTVAEPTLSPPGHIVAVASATASEVLEITGTDRYGNTVVEDITLNDATPVVGTTNFATIESVVADGATTAEATVDVGSDDALETKWVPLDWRKDRTLTTFTVLGSSDANMTAEVQVAYEPDLFEITEDGGTFTDSSLSSEEVESAVDMDAENLVAVSETDRAPTAARVAVTSFVAGDLTFIIHQP